MIGQYVEPKRTVITSTEALLGFRDGWRNLFGRAPTAGCIAVLTAQSALESGWWKSMWNFNPSNIKAGSKWAGLYTCIRLNERLDGKYVWFSPTGREGPVGTVSSEIAEVPPGHPQTRMRAFETFGKGVTNKLAFLSENRWLRARAAAEAGDPSTYVQECKAQGYFTAELGPYLRSVVSITGKLMPDALEVLSLASPPEQPEPADDIGLCLDMAACQRSTLPDWLRAIVRAQQAEHLDFALDLVQEDRDRDVQGADS